jgi:hypothetical protein
MMRLILTTIILTMLAPPVWADTSNRMKQFALVPGMFVGGVGLVCTAKIKTKVQFLLLTKDRKKIGIANFESGDIEYAFRQITKTTLRSYISHSNAIGSSELTLDRRSLELSFDQKYQCNSMSISDLHKNAGNHLRSLLRENQI